MRVILTAFALLFALGPRVFAEPPTFQQINEACGGPLLADENLWDDDAEAVAARLGWPRESQTSHDSSYRLYPPPEARFFGARPYSQVLLAEDGQPVGLSQVFANKGDAVTAVPGRLDNREARTRRTELREYHIAIGQDEKTLADALTALLGAPSNDRFGQGRETAESVRRWNWNGHAFLLAAPRGEYVALRILPADMADTGGNSRVADDIIRARALSRVEKRPNGDVVLRDIPMVNQGPKGYCVPATWERAMRSMGVPADMYVLAMAGGTGAGGGTSVEDITWGARDAVTRAGRRMESPSIKLTPEGVAKFIDRGLPILWALSSTDEFNAAANTRTKARLGMSDPAAWRASLEDARKAGKKMRPDKESGHVCMITGYNAATDELCISDSWGPGFEERWITPEEAAAVTQGRCYVLEL